MSRFVPFPGLFLADGLKSESQICPFLVRQPGRVDETSSTFLSFQISCSGGQRIVVADRNKKKEKGKGKERKKASSFSGFLSDGESKQSWTI